VLEEELKVEWPSLIGRDDNLWKHEWSDHGCFGEISVVKSILKKVIFTSCAVSKGSGKG